MKVIKLFSAVFLLTTFVSCGVRQYARFGSLTSISSRNIDDSKKYVLLKRDATEICYAESDPLNVVMDIILEKYKGEFLRNVKIYISSEKDQGGTNIKLVADVWGLSNPDHLKVGDMVLIKRIGFLEDNIIEAKIIGLKANTVYVEDKSGKKMEVKYDEVTKSKN